MRLLLLDNYDSFTYNLMEVFRRDKRLEPVVLRNDAVTVEEAGAYDILAFSPGPGLPDEAGYLLEIIRTYAGVKPMFGVCLGLQAMGMVFGARLYNLKDVCHGVSTQVCVHQPDDPVFHNIPEEFPAGRYHSWALEVSSMPDHFQPLAVSTDGVIMAARHTQYPVYGLQFHPESIMTPNGTQIISNFINHVFETHAQ